MKTHAVHTHAHKTTPSTYTLNDFIEDYCFREEETHTYTLHQGSVTLLGSEIIAPCGFVEVKAWVSDGFRKVWISYNEKAIITFCEGDISVRHYNEMQDFVAGLNANHTFYTDGQSVLF